MRPLLVVEDDPGMQKQLKWAFDDYEVVVAPDRAKAMAELRRHQPGVVTLDLGLPPDPANASEGLAALSEILREYPRTKVIVVTGNDDRANAVKAVSEGAYDFYQKPIDAQTMALMVQRAFKLFDLEQEFHDLLASESRQMNTGLFATSREMMEVCRTVEKVADTDASILLLGESGTGKELLARALHAQSSRRDGPFIAINCAAIPENLLESELFGHEKGSFTGADKRTLGKVEYANGGTLLLDEVGDLPASLQAKLLRFLQERVIERIGGRQEIEVDTRVVCATHRDLTEAITAGEFREDLYYRIGEISIRVPPLRDRPGDATLLARNFLRRFAEDYRQTQLRGLSQDALDAIEAYAWPGNVRELENKMKRAVIMSEGRLVTAADLELPLPENTADRPVTLKDVRERAESDAVQRALLRTDNNISEAAALLGVSRPTMYELLKKYDLRN